MSKFNATTRGIHQTRTYEGGPATFVQNPKEDLVRRVLTTFVNEPKFYGNVQNQTQNLINSLQKVIEKDPKFVMNLAKYTRNELYMRSVTHMIVGELARSQSGKPYVKEAIKNVALRPDDLTEILAYYLINYGKPIPNSLKKGLASAFSKFNEYQLQKYNRKQAVTLKDVLCLTHAKPYDAIQGEMWGRLLNDNLETPYTWETELSAKGNTKEVWEQLIASEKVGYMALLRNLKNILMANPDNIGSLLHYIKNPKAVKSSKQLPFRFYAAYREISNITNAPNSFLITKMLNAISEALQHSVNNLETIRGNTVLVTDDSGSMTWSNISQRSSITSAEIAALMMAIANNICENTITSAFSSNYRIFNLNPSNSILTNVQEVSRNFQGGATRMEKIFHYLIQNNVIADRIIIFSDNEASDYPQQAWKIYKENINPNAWLHLIDLAGYGHQIFHGDNVTYTPGWSEKILKFIPLIESNKQDIVKEIENYKS
jgi:60 kDa SS-A/Ro ribonucleoprotein